MTKTIAISTSVKPDCRYLLNDCIFTGILTLSVNPLPSRLTQRNDRVPLAMVIGIGSRSFSENLAFLGQLTGINESPKQGARRQPDDEIVKLGTGDFTTPMINKHLVIGDPVSTAGGPSADCRTDIFKLIG